MRAASAHTHVSRAQSVRAYLILRPVYGNINAREQDMQWAEGIFARTHIYTLNSHKMYNPLSAWNAPKRERATHDSLSAPSIADLLYSIACALN